MQDFVVLDLETTGFSPETCEIIEIGAWKVQNGVVTDKFNMLVRPILYIPRTVQNLTGITMEMVADCETIDTILVEFFDWCGSLPFLGFNLPFDYSFLCVKGRQLGVDFTLDGSRLGIDVMHLVKKYTTQVKHSLGETVKAMNIDLGGNSDSYHRASFDAYATKLIYDRFLLNYPKVLEITTPTVLDKNNSEYGKVVNNDTLSFN